MQFVKTKNKKTGWSSDGNERTQHIDVLVISNSEFSVKNYKKTRIGTIQQQKSISIHHQHGRYKIKKGDRSCKSDFAMVF